MGLEKVHDVLTVQSSEHRRVGMPRSCPPHLSTDCQPTLVIKPNRRSLGLCSLSLSLYDMVHRMSDHTGSCCDAMNEMTTNHKQHQYAKCSKHSIVSLAGQSLLGMYAASLVIAKVKSSTVHYSSLDHSPVIKQNQPEKLKAERNAVANAETPPGTIDTRLSQQQ